MENVKRTHSLKIQAVKKAKREVCEREYTKTEEVIHSITHGAGALLGVVGLIVLIMKVIGQGTLNMVSAAIYGASLIILYSASCAYHTSCAVYGENTVSPVRDFCMKCDHSLIFILILGTYTPACLSAIGGWIGYTVFGVVASCSLIGITLNIISVERFQKISMFLYLLAGWMIVVALVPFYNAIGPRGIAFLVAGGILYTIGVVFYKLKRIPNMHIIWHLFVLGGSIMHYIMVYFYCY